MLENCKVIKYEAFSNHEASSDTESELNHTKRVTVISSFEPLSVSAINKSQKSRSKHGSTRNLEQRLKEKLLESSNS